MVGGNPAEASIDRFCMPSSNLVRNHRSNSWQASIPVDADVAIRVTPQFFGQLDEELFAEREIIWRDKHRGRCPMFRQGQDLLDDLL